MPNDIVDELRTHPLPDMLSNHSELLEKAADEIERLRELADNFYKTLLYYPCQCGISPCKCGYDDMMDEYKEVRGE